MGSIGGWSGCRQGSPSRVGSSRKRRRTISKTAAILLAAGESRRWGADNKLLAPIDSKPMVRRTAEMILASSIRPVLVVTGHEAADVQAALANLPLSFHHAPDFAEGMSASLRAGM